MAEGFLIADFNGDNLINLMRADHNSPSISLDSCPFAQALTVLVDKKASYWNKSYDFVLVWTRPEIVSPNFAKLMEFQQVSEKDILNDVEQFSMMVKAMASKQKMVFVINWALPASFRGYGILDLRGELGIRHQLLQMNLKLENSLQDAPSVYVLNLQQWTEQIGKQAFSEKLWYMAKCPFSQEVFLETIADIKSAMNLKAGHSKKLIVLDLDDTLWGGILGEVGLKNLRLGGHDPVGEAYVDFQRALKALKNKGFLLAIASKNEESLALEAIRLKPEMILKEEDFVAWRINWKDKAQNIAELAAELNLGLDSVVFIDDNHMERDRVRKALPQVQVPEWPQNKMLLRSTLQSLRCFDLLDMSQEDKNRTQMYQEDRQRKEAIKQIGSVEEWLRSLNIRVVCEKLNEANLARIIQLFNKTNQMNLSTRRMTEKELMQWLLPGKRQLWSFRVSDNIGDSGLVGIISVDVVKQMIVDYILSCRVIGKGVERAMIYQACRYLRELGLQGELHSQYIPTEKNKPCLDFWQSSGFAEGRNYVFSWDLSKPYALPEHIQFEEITQ